MFTEALENIDQEILLNGERINNICYADDTAVFDNSLIGLQELMNSINGASEQYGLKFNISKTEFMIVSKQNIRNFQLFIRENAVKRVSKFTYLRTIIINEQ